MYYELGVVFLYGVQVGIKVNVVVIVMVIDVIEDIVGMVGFNVECFVDVIVGKFLVQKQFLSGYGLVQGQGVQMVDVWGYVKFFMVVLFVGNGLE